jgi:DNA polymerase III delta subunit
MSEVGAALGYFHGDDGYGLERAADAMAARLAMGGGPVERWRVSGDATSAARVAERVGTGSLFGGGTLAIVVDPAPLLRAKEDRTTLVDTLRHVADGNGLVFLESSDGSRRSKALEDLAKAVAAAGGEVRELRAPKEAQLAGWVEARARERTIALGPGASREIATRVGGFVHEGDIDRRRMGELAVREIEKLALYRPDGQVTVDDVRALVAEVVPGSAWAFLDAIAARRVPRALELLDRLLGSTHELVLLAQLHRRIRELIEVGDLVASGARPATIVSELKLKPFRAEKLVEQTRAWELPELDAALEGLLQLDALVRGANGTASDPGRVRLAFSLWIADRVARVGVRAGVDGGAG